MVGLAFMTKMLQGWMVVPALAAAYLLAGPPSLLVRVRQLPSRASDGRGQRGLAAGGLAVAGGEPYIGGSTDGSVWDLILGYNGFGRIFGEGGGMGGGGGFGGTAGLLADVQRAGRRPDRLAAAARRGQLAAGLWLTRARRGPTARAGWVLFGVWALVHVAVFTSQQGIFHPYYVSALAPAVAALAGMGVVRCGAARESWAGAAARRVAGTAWLAVDLLAARRTSRRGCGWRSRSPPPWRRSAPSRCAWRRAAFAGGRRDRRRRWRGRAGRRAGGLQRSRTSAAR